MYLIWPKIRMLHATTERRGGRTKRSRLHVWKGTNATKIDEVLLYRWKMVVEPTGWRGDGSEVKPAWVVADLTPRGVDLPWEGRRTPKPVAVAGNGGGRRVPISTLLGGHYRTMHMQQPYQWIASLTWHKRAISCVPACQLIWLEIPKTPSMSHSSSCAALTTRGWWPVVKQEIAQPHFTPYHLFSASKRSLHMKLAIFCHSAKYLHLGIHVTPFL